MADKRADERTRELKTALDNGVSRTELIELVAQIADYTPQIPLCHWLPMSRSSPFRG
jgi:hypothetical protein